MNTEQLNKLINDLEAFFAKENDDKCETAQKQTQPDRFILGICGAPGAGKSTLADWLVTEWNLRHPNAAALVPMDGYHYSNEELSKRNLLALKGIPDTFNAEAFIEKLRCLKNDPNSKHSCPRFDRSIEASIEDDIHILPEHKLLVVEGNYLLLDSNPWSELKSIFNQTWYLDTDEELILPRLMQRHREGGRTNSEADKKVNSTDLPNARLVAKSACRADRVLKAIELQSTE